MQFNFFDLLVIVCGLYMAYCAVMMKTKGRINSGVVMSRNLDESMLKDKEGFIRFIWPKLLCIGILCAVSGIFNLVYSAHSEENPQTYVLVEIIVNSVFFILLIVYGVIVAKAQKRFMK
ncbi:MAG: hypothetical protein IJ058_02880 [Lachnospiraceae bacterium]|nr:hypothetical protein [Lachnospiraceae bacterium]